MTSQIYQVYLANSVLVMTAAILFYAAMTDLKHYQIRNEVIAVLGGLFVLHAVLSGRWPGLPWNVGLALLVFVVMLYFYSQNLMGGGDVKLLTVAFLWVGIDCALPFAILLSLFAAIHAGAGKLGWAEVRQAGEDKRSRIAFAPAVAAALIATFMLGCLAPVSP
jgi:prepilin peptidase CpaA